MTVRNIRAYQARGLLPPPVVDGRVGFYNETHRERLRMIRRLRSEGFNLVAISALLTGVVPVTTPTVSLVEPDGERSSDPTDPSPPDSGAALLALGVPVDAVLELRREVARSVETIAAAYARVYDDYVRGPWLAVGSPESTHARVSEATATLPGIATSAVSAALVPAVRRAVEAQPSVSVLERSQGSTTS
ncbi:hypothetical protein acdb102_11960 [Acidothermaceae bacterium B102]|nr:hypothetical protein acdb102_11960 [Acidothermaceae bacterium B102]